jgi:DNA-directed RNA polymerase alpha subunit
MSAVLFEVEEIPPSYIEPPELSDPIENAELHSHTLRILRKIGVRTIGDLTKKTDRELLEFKGFGKSSLSDVKCVLNEAQRQSLVLSFSIESWRALCRAALAALLDERPPTEKEFLLRGSFVKDDPA